MMGYSTRLRQGVKRVICWTAAIAITPLAFGGILEDALDEPLLTWTTGGAQPWGAQTNVTLDGVDAAQSGVLDPSQDSLVQTTVSGPGTLSFWWKSANPGALATLSFESGDLGQDAGIMSVTDWRQRAVAIPEGDHVLRWRYSSYIYVTNGDAAYLDNVHWVPGETLYCLSVDGVGGTVTANPSQELYIPGTPVSLTAIPNSNNTFIGWSGDASGVENPLNLIVQTNMEIKAVFGRTNTPDAAVLESTNLTFFTGGDAPWEGQDIFTHDGEDAAQCGWLTAGQESWMSTDVTGPGMLVFWCKASYEEYADWTDSAELRLDGEIYNCVSGSDDWHQEVIDIGEGTHRHTWRFSKVLDRWMGENRMWVDGVSWYPGVWKTLDVYAGEGTVTCNPEGLAFQNAGSRFPDGTEVTLTAIPPPGQRFVRWAGDIISTNNVLQIVMDSDMSVFPTFAYELPTFEEALDCPTMCFQRSNSPDWIGQTNVTWDGQDAAATAAFASGQTAWVKTEIDGPKFVHFATRIDVMAQIIGTLTVSGESSWSSTLSGQWTEQWTYVGPGHHILRWQWQHEYFGGPVVAMLDAVEFREVFTIDEALDASDLTWETNAGGGWLPELSASHDGEDAVKVAMDGAPGTRWLETTVEGPGILGFWWCLSGMGRFAFAVDGITNAVLAEASIAWKLQGTSIPAGTHTIRWEPSGGSYSFPGYLDEVSFSSMSNFADAVEAPELSWTTGGPSTWCGQTDVAIVDGDALRSGSIGANQTSYLEVNIAGPSILKFWWKVSSEPAGDPSIVYPGDTLQVLVDGRLRAEIAGEVDWQQQAITLPSSNHVIRWQYLKDPDGDVGEDAAWLDGVEVIPPIPLADALDAPELTWTMGEGSEWVGQSAVSADGSDAAELVWSNAGPIFYLEGWIQTTVTGPGRIRFSFKPRVELYWPWGNPASFSIEGGGTSQLAASGDWKTHVFDVPAGQRALRWTCPGDVGCWLDQVVWRTDVMYSHWLSRHFSAGEIANPLIGGFHADPDGDGACNGLEAALGTDPRLHDTPPGGMLTSCSLPLPPGASDHLKLVFDRAEDAPYDVTLLVQVSSTLEPDSWATIAQKTGVNPWTGSASVSEGTPGGGRVRVTVYDTVISRDHSRRFMRVVASQSAP